MNHTFALVLTLGLLAACDAHIPMQRSLGETCAGPNDCQHGLSCVPDASGQTVCVSTSSSAADLSSPADASPTTDADPSSPADASPTAAADLSRPADASPTADAGLPPMCMDGILDGMETDVDCGGPICPPCNPGRVCVMGSDCLSGLCRAFRCTLPDSCINGIRDGMETDVDCGGDVCLPCGAGRGCLLARDCRDATCVMGTCALPPLCADGIKDGSETDVDCGGPDCLACPNHKACSTASDCLSGACLPSNPSQPTSNPICLVATCGDNLKDGSETDVDCGGPDCAPCGDGHACLVASDCLKLSCVGGVCSGNCTTDNDCGWVGGVTTHRYHCVNNWCTCDATVCAAGCCFNTGGPHQGDPQCILSTDRPASHQSCGTMGGQCFMCSGLMPYNYCMSPGVCLSTCAGCWTAIDGQCVPGNQDSACGTPFGPGSDGFCQACPSGQHCLNFKCQ